MQIYDPKEAKKAVIALRLTRARVRDTNGERVKKQQTSREYLKVRDKAGTLAGIVWRHAPISVSILILNRDL